jgi:hypothetical protein
MTPAVLAAVAAICIAASALGLWATKKALKVLASWGKGRASDLQELKAEDGSLPAEHHGKAGSVLLVGCLGTGLLILKSLFWWAVLIVGLCAGAAAAILHFF